VGSTQVRGEIARQLVDLDELVDLVEARAQSRVGSVCTKAQFKITIGGCFRSLASSENGGKRARTKVLNQQRHVAENDGCEWQVTSQNASREQRVAWGLWKESQKQRELP
jgi:hypothetical protein